ncbi:retropepsin-like aspartic protease [Bradyrhizobium sp. 33ap4]|uniref:retropepsin-like aspartic protease n=1 Tax=Bradyrhizobium sp. 33ap4 TaxID=3061630 RepID=UPI00292FE30A|nr:retropepsin-like aspartic protease [Bradyrhizobium sp. 33ap4]
MTPDAEQPARGDLTNNLRIVIDGREIIALVDTGADDCIISAKLAADLRKVTTPWDGPQIRTAGNHLLTPYGKCTASVSVRGVQYVVSFIVLENSARDVILGMDFLRENGAVIDLDAGVISFRIPCEDCDNQEANEMMNDTSAQVNEPVFISDSCVDIPPWSTASVAVHISRPCLPPVLVEGSMDLFLQRGIGVARGLVDFQRGNAEILVTNFRCEPQRLRNGSKIGTFADIMPDQTLSLLAEDAKLQCRTQGPQFDVNPELQSDYRRRLLGLLHEYEGCFSTSERVQQTHTAKHRIIVDDTVRPIKQMPYRVSQKERETIQRQVQEMLDDDVIQPSCSPWSSPVVLVKKKTAPCGSAWTTEN